MMGFLDSDSVIMILVAWKPYLLLDLPREVGHTIVPKPVSRLHL